MGFAYPGALGGGEDDRDAVVGGFERADEGKEEGRMVWVWWAVVVEELARCQWVMYRLTWWLENGERVDRKAGVVAH